MHIHISKHIIIYAYIYINTTVLYYIATPRLIWRAAGAPAAAGVKQLNL